MCNFYNDSKNCSFIGLRTYTVFMQSKILSLKTAEYRRSCLKKIMALYFPVSEEKLRETCGYDKNRGSYPYEPVLGRAHPPFGEVVGCEENPDGTLTLTVDGVWIDYNSDCAFTNRIVVQPFEDGTFKYLSNSIEKKDLEIPVI